MEDIRLSLNDEALFGRLIGLTPSMGIGIVIDTTQSMKRHWNDVITGITEKLKKFENDSKITTNPPQYYLTQFNDPDYQNVYQTSNLNDILQTLSSITPSGGGDIPEMCYPALLDTFNEMMPGCAVFVYTDAISKKEELLGQIKTVAAQKKITISFIMLGENESNSNKTSCCFCTFSSGLCQYSCCSSGHVELW